MNKKNPINVVISLLTITLIVAFSYALYFRSLYYKEKNQKAISQKNNKSPRKISKKKEPAIADLKNRIKELEYQLQAKIMPVTTEVQKSTRNFGNSSSQKQTLEEIKVSNPERYKEIISYYKRINGSISDAAQDKLIYFSELDTNWMSKDQKQSNQRLLEKLAQLDELSQNNLNRDGRELKDAVKDQQNMLRNLYRDLRKQKDFLFANIGRDLGLSDAEAKSLKKRIKQVEDITSYRSFYHRKKK